jgi:hypothetical protein
VRPRGAPLAQSDNAAYFRQVVTEFGLEQQSALLLTGNTDTVGQSYAALRKMACSADVLLSISGMLTDEALLEPIQRRVYLDLDPAFNQLWHATQGIDMRFGGHTHFATVGLAMGQAECTVPTLGLPWITTPPPVVLSEWPAAEQIEHDALTTIANWRGYGSIEHEGISYGQKAHSLRPFMTLPTLTQRRFSPALAIDPGEERDVAALAANRWALLNPSVAAGTPDDYRRFIQGSWAEFGIAKQGYVVSRSGWFSDRSACYLASGRPVLAQETGFSQFLPTGEGLFRFETIDDVLAAIDALERDYARHARAARALAEAYLDSDKVLTTLLERVGGGS